MIVHKRAACAPVKLNDTKFHKDPPGISGALLEGRQYYDLFVFGAKCDGVYVEVNTANGAGVICEAPSVSDTVDFTSATAGVTFKYTTDGSDPRSSETRAVYTAAIAVTAPVTIKAFAEKEGSADSAVAEAAYTIG
jgi:hypothetical protein